jgi:hypothetical protein
MYGWFVGACIGVFVLVVAPMIHPLDKNYLIPTHWRIVFATVLVASAVACFLLARGWLRWALFVALGVMCAFAVRVWIDIARDRSNHNLLPFELVFDFASVLFWSAIGAAGGQSVRRLADRPTEGGTWTPRWKRPRS